MLRSLTPLGLNKEGQKDELISDTSFISLWLQWLEHAVYSSMFWSTNGTQSMCSI